MGRYDAEVCKNKHGREAKYSEFLTKLIWYDLKTAFYSFLFSCHFIRFQMTFSKVNDYGNKWYLKKNVLLISL